MLTSSNQYLRPEYLTPLPTTLDAKKSPLALLAQTCSQIGADSPNTKLLQNSGDKSAKSKTDSKDKSLTVTDNSTNANHATSKPSYYKPYESSLSREKSKTPEERSSSSSSANRVRTPVSSKQTGIPLTPSSAGSANGRCNSSNHSVTTSPRGSPIINVNTSERRTPVESNSRGEDSSTPSRNSDRTNSPSTSTSTTTTPKTSLTNTSVLTSTTDHTVKDLPLGTFKPGVALPPTSAYLSAYHPSAGLPLGMDLMTSSLMAHHHAAAAMKSGSLSPYLNYARMKAPGDPMAGICRDPYCSGCSLSSHLMNVAAAGKAPGSGGSCPAGCTQCDHATSKQQQQQHNPYNMGHNPAAAAYAHAQLAALAAASHLPYVCNWISGDAAYCGKRFSSSEELLNHLRTHTSNGGSSVSDSNAAALSMLSATSGLPPNHPLFHRTYPTPPLSPLATARYHPYSKPSLLPPSLSSPLSSYSLAAHPGLPPYLSPYSLYGPPRMGSAPGMHP